VKADSKDLDSKRELASIAGMASPTQTERVMASAVQHLPKCKIFSTQMQKVACKISSTQMEDYKMNNSIYPNAKNKMQNICLPLTVALGHPLLPPCLQEPRL